MKVPVDMANSDAILDYVCEVYRVKKSEIVSSNRSHELVEVRCIAIHIIRTVIGMKLKAIGKIFGRDHSTIIYNLQLFNDLMFSSPEFKRKFRMVQRIIE